MDIRFSFYSHFEQFKLYTDDEQLKRNYYTKITKMLSYRRETALQGAL